ncbi:MAG: hypothetical protein JWQ59_524 [Cryobacterium sp.]|jgi:hypothetical protein|nr:hypothetical protein [Cryobacterium sp.]
MTGQDSSRSRNPWKIAWAIVGGVAVLVGLATGVLTLQSQLTGPPTFRSTIESVDQSADFANFLKDNDGKQVQLDVTCKSSSTGCYLPNADEASFLSNLFDGQVLVLYTLHPCDGDDMFLCTSGTYWLDLTEDPTANVQINNGSYGAGSLVVKGSFSVNVEGQLGSLPPEIMSVNVRGR